MVIKSEDQKLSVRSEMRGGKGDIGMRELLPAEMLMGKGRLFSIMTVEPGCSVGLHDHQGEAEIYFVLEGELAGTDNGQPVTLRAGDVMYTGDGSNHSVENLSSSTARVMALILFS